MKTLVRTLMAVASVPAFAGGALAHTGREAHVHATGGPLEQLAHWAAGIVHWSPVTFVLLGVALGLVVCIARPRRGVRGSRN